MASNQELTNQLQALTAEVGRLADENRILKERTEGGIGAIPALAQAVAQLAIRPEGLNKLVDNTGIGKPSSFDGTESKYREWSTWT